MKTFRVDVTFDYVVDDDVDPDQFHDDLRDNYDSGVLQTEGYRLESVRELEVEELAD